MRTRLATFALLVLAAAAPAADLDALRARYQREKGQTYQVRYTVLTEISKVGTDAAAKLLIRISETDDDSSMRSNALYWLGRVPVPRATEFLLRTYRDGPETLRHSAFNALANRNEPLPPEIVDEALSSDQSGTRSTVIRYLQRRKDPRFLPEVERFLGQWPTSSASMTSVLVMDKSPRAARILVRIYDDSRKYDRDNVPKMFADGSDELRGVLIAVLTGRVTVDELVNAATLVARAKVEEAEPAIVAALPGAKEERRVLLLETIGALGAPSVEGRHALRDSLEDRSEAIRTAAVRGLRTAPDRLAIPILIGMLGKSKTLLRQEVRVTLERMTGNQFGEDADLWTKWWATHGGEFRLDDVRKVAEGALDQALVDLAIEKGARALRGIRGLRGLRGEKPPWVYAGHPLGTTALVVLALHASGAGPKDRDIRAGVKYLLDQPVPDRTYDLGCVAMALETVHGRKVRRRIGECAKRLVATQNAKGMWGYPSGNGDNSCTQYAVLGLRSAARVGIVIPKRVWRAIREHFLRTKAYEGGWYYPGIERGTTSTASMTSAGVCSLLICLENEGLKPGSAEDTALRQAIDDGFTALGKVMKMDRDSLYALYGIERAGILGRRAVMADKAWYPLGARRLLDEQGRDGFWRAGYNEAVQTAFAILFLKKATAPITGD